MATWPSGSKASTSNVDAGTDSPASARTDLKQAIDNQNQIIDMFDISSPADGEILKYSTANSKFELAADAGVESLSDLSDVVITDAANGEILIYNGTNWINGDAGIDFADLSVGAEITASGNGSIEYNNTNGVFTYTPPTASGIGALANIVEDTTPQLGGSLDVNGNSIVSASNGNITLAPNGTGKVVISGDLQIDGTTTTVNSTTMDVDDINITIAKGAANAAAANGAGLTVEGPATAATLLYASADDSWNLNKKTAVPELQVDNINVNGNTISSTDTNGNITITPNGTGDVQLNADTIRVGDHNSDVTISSYGTGNLTLNTHTGTNSGIIRINQGNNGNIEITPDGTGSIVLDGLNWPQADGTNGQVLATNGTGTLSFTTISSGSSTLDELTDVVITTPATGEILIYNGTDWINGDAGIDAVQDDTEPTLGGDLDVNGNKIASSANGDIEIEPNGTGNLVLDGLTWPQADGTNGQVLTTDGAGNLSFTTVSGGSGLANIVEDLTPQLGGDLDVQANIITTSTTNGNITITPDGTGDVILSTDSVQVGESTSQARITTSGGNLRLDSNSGTNSGYIMIYAGANGTIELEPNGTGDVWLRSDTVVMGDDNTAAFITTTGTGSLTLNTNAGSNSGTITINHSANGNITLTPNGTGQTAVKNLEYQEYVHALGTTSGTVAPNAANGNVQTITLNGNLTINGFTSPVSGQTITLIITTGGTGRTLTSSMLFAGGSKTLSTTSTVDILTMSYIGTSYYASLVKGYA